MPWSLSISIDRLRLINCSALLFDAQTEEETLPERGINSLSPAPLFLFFFKYEDNK